MAFFTRRKCRMMMSMLLLISVIRLQAQQQKLSLAALTGEAVRYLPLLKQKQANVNTATAALTATRHSFLPQVKAGEEISIGTDNSLGGSYFTLGMIPSTSAGVRAANNAQAETGNIAILYGEYELYNFGLNAARLNNASADINLQMADLRKEQYLVELQVARCYFSILKMQYRLYADRQNIHRYDSVFTVIRALASSGIKPGSDSSMARAELSKAKVNYNQTLGQFRQMKDELGYLTGIAAEKLVLDTAALHPENHPVGKDTAGNASDIPLINYYLSRRNIFLTNEQVIKKSYLPKIMLAASTWARGSGIQYNDDYKPLQYGLGYQRFNYMAGLAVTYNLFSGLHKKDQLAINRSRWQASDLELQQQTLAVQLALQKAEHALQTAGANYLEIPVQLRSAEETYRQKLAQYKAGLISLIDLINASFVLYRSQIDYSEGLTDLFQALLDKAAATGELYSFIQSFK